MNDELNLDSIEAIEQEKLQVKDRFAKLTEKGLEADKRAKEEAEARAQAESRATLAEKERDFFKSFSQISAKHPGASDYQDQILEKVNKGYDPEDATLAILAKEGKLTMNTPQQSAPNIAGGSAQTNLGDGGNKTVSDMSQAEKMEALMQAEREGANLLRF